MMVQFQEVQDPLEATGDSNMALIACCQMIFAFVLSNVLSQLKP
jgi:hypothetical protein